MPEDLRSRDEFADGFWIGNWFVEPMLNRVRHEDDEEVQLEPKVMEVLLCMAERPEKTVTKEQFKEVVWTDTVVTDDVLSRCISELRKVFNDDSRDPSYIETIRKTGYRLIAPVRTPEVSSEPDTNGSGSDPPPSDDQPTFEDLSERVSTNLQMSWTEARDSWVVVAGGIVERKWVFVIGAGVGLLLLLLSLQLWSDVDIGTASTPPEPSMPLTSFPGEEFDPALSSSGRQFVFSWRNADSLYQNIYLMQQGADRPLRLSADTTVDWSPTWSPNERFIAYARSVNGEHQVRIVPSIGGQGRLVKRLPGRRLQSVSWSPDTSRTVLALSAQQRPHQAFGLSLVVPDADSTRSLTAPPLWSTGDTAPTFSPNGSKVAFIRGLIAGVEDIFVVPTEGGAPSQITTDSTTIRGVTWAADGEALVYSAERNGVQGLWQVDADGGEPALLRTASEGTLFSDPTVSGSRLAYTQQSAELDIWTLRRPRSTAAFQAEQVLTSTQEDTHPAISPDGSRLAFISERSGQAEVWVSPLDGSTPHKITSLQGPSLRSVMWSPDGSHLSFIARRKGTSNLFVVPATGGARSQLTTTPGEILSPRWGRDGEWLYFASNRTGAWEIWRTNRNDTTRTQQVTTGGGLAAQEAPTGSTLYLVRPDTMGIWATPLNTSQFPIRTGPAASTNRLSPSTSGQNESSLRQVTSQFAPEDFPNWWAGEEQLYFLHRRRPQATVLNALDYTSGQSTSLYTFPDWHPTQNIAVGPNGDVFAYTHVVQQERDIMLMEDFQP